MTHQRSNRRPKVPDVYIRFATSELHRNSTRPIGIFAAAYALLESKALSDADEKHIREILNWFSQNLPIPKRFATDGAIFWFKSEAKVCTRKVWQLALALRHHSLQVEMHRTRRPGYVIYEDEFQVGAIPFHDTL